MKGNVQCAASDCELCSAIWGGEVVYWPCLCFFYKIKWGVGDRGGGGAALQPPTALERQIFSRSLVDLKTSDYTLSAVGPAEGENMTDTHV